MYKWTSHRIVLQRMEVWRSAVDGSFSPLLPSHGLFISLSLFSLSRPELFSTTAAFSHLYNPHLTLSQFRQLSHCSPSFFFSPVTPTNSFD